jgi:hypothetical protein
MIKRFHFFLLAIFLSPACLLASHSEVLSTPSGIAVEMSWRIIEPGEIIVVRIEDTTDIEEAQVRFLENKFQMGRDGENHRLLAFICLGLDLEAGFYALKVYIRKTSGKWESVQKRIIVPAKKFPLRKLWVDERFLIPPPEFHERIEWEAEVLRVIYDMFTPRWLGEGNFIFPAPGMTNLNFGERRIFNNYHRSLHRGVDVASPSGSPVIASNSGKIVLARNLYYAGNAVIIDHGLGVFTFYCHFSKIRVKRGDVVRKGDVIGSVGATGRVTGPHLHWSVRVGGKNVDPFSLLSLSLE